MRIVGTLLARCLIATGLMVALGARFAVLAQVTTASADMQIRAAAVTFQAGRQGNYVIGMTNQGPSATNQPIILHVELSDGLSFAAISSPWTCEADGQLVTCTNLTSIPPHSGTSFVLTVDVGAAAVPRATTRLTVDYPGDTRALDNSALKFTSVRPSRRPLNTATPTPTTTPSFGTAVPTRTPSRTATATRTRTATVTRTPVPSSTDVSLKKTNFGTFAVGINGTYMLTVSNLGTHDTNALLSVVDTLPNSLGYVSATGTSWDCGADGQTVTCTRLDALPALSSSIITLVVSIGDSAFPTLTNSATLSYPGDTDLTNNLARKPTTVRRPPRQANRIVR
jgi:uncharacterized repeat protein (TIGR01451 family)